MSATPAALAVFYQPLEGRTAGQRWRLQTGLAQFITATRGRKVDCLTSSMDQTCCSIFVEAAARCRESGGCRQQAAWHRFWRHRGVKGVRQTLSDGGARNGDVDRGFPDSA